MAGGEKLVCDGCGQAATAEHIAARLRRLEQATRFRPVHIQTLFLGAAAPVSGFLYDIEQGSSGRAATGEGRAILEATGLWGRPGTIAETLAEFQHRGYFLTHVMECPADGIAPGIKEFAALLRTGLPRVLARIRRSLKPKRIALIAEGLAELIGEFGKNQTGAGLLLDGGNPFALDAGAAEPAKRNLARALGVSAGGV